MSQIDKIIGLEIEIDTLIEDAKKEAAALLETYQKKAEAEIDVLKKDYENKVKALDQQTTAIIKKLETEFLQDKEALNHKIEKDYQEIVEKSIDRLKKEVVNL